jgi:NADH-quinone oxidoreductase subunit G
MAILHIDGKQYEAEAGKNLLHVCLSHGLDLPYFCWHPALGSVGACRQCAVKQYRDENDTQGRIVMSCMTPVTDGMRITLEDPGSKEFRGQVIESLMTNHPHDCPICDEGGECHLQDMTVMSGHNYRDYRFKKRTFNNQYLGPFINHEMNRCITCYRCVRFYRDYAGGDDLDAFASKNHVYFGRFEDGALENEFSGNLVEVCPTGVFTDKTLKEHYTRKWDLQTAPSICTQCGLGCNTIPGERYGQLRRILNRYNGEVNGYFLCDRGRFGYSFVNSAKRIRTPMNRRAGAMEPITKEVALGHIAILLAEGKAIGIGSPRASLEGNFALRTLVGPERFYNGMSEKESGLVALAIEILQKGPARAASLRETEEADAVLVLGEDVTNTAPRVALSLRQSVRRQPIQVAAKANIPEWHDLAIRELVQDAKGPFYVASPNVTRLDDIATATYRAAPDDIARLGFAVAHILNPDAPAVPSLSPEVSDLATRIAAALKSAKRPLVVSGTGCGSEAVLEAAANVAWALSTEGRHADICLAVPECNSLGVALMERRGVDQAFEALRAGEADTVIVLENDLYRRASRKEVDELLPDAKHLIIVDHGETLTTAKAEVVLPAGTFAESDGTLVNNEGRAQVFLQVFVPEGGIQESWRWLCEIMASTGHATKPWENLEAISMALDEALQAFASAHEEIPSAAFRIEGQRIPRQPHRYSGRTAMKAHINIHEQKPPADPDTPMSFSMEGFLGKAPSPLVSRFWSPGWNSVQSLNKFQDEVGGHMRGGDSGRRLIEPSQDTARYYNEIPAPFAAREGEFLVAPMHHIFGSEELSVLSDAVAQRSPKPYLALNPTDASRLGVAAGDSSEIGLKGVSYRLPVQISEALPKGVAGVPVGLPEMASELGLPSWAKASKVEAK